MSTTNTVTDDTIKTNITETLLEKRNTDNTDNNNIYKFEDYYNKFTDKNEFKEKDVKLLSWKLLDDYFKNPLRLTQHHIDSYNKFISYIIPKRIKDYNPVIVKSGYSSTKKKYMEEYHITFSNVYIGKPGIKENDGKTKMMYPMDARWRNLTYSADLYVDVDQKYIKHSETTSVPPAIKEYPTMKKISLRTIPIMVKSKFCPLSSTPGRSQSELGECEYDKGGYFIVKGSEKVLVCQERKCENKILAFSQNKTQTAYSNTVEISSVPSIHSFVRTTQLKMYKKSGNKTIQVFIQRFKIENPIPLFIVFRALGITSDKDIMEKILYNPLSSKNKECFELLIPSINEASSIQTQEMALLYMANYVSRFPEMKEGDETEEKFRQNYVMQLLKTELFPHVGESFIKKAWFLGMMARKLIDTKLNIRPYDDRDSFINKRISSSGILLEELFRNNFNKLIKDIMKAVENDMKQGRINEIHTTIKKKIERSTIENSIRYSLGTGTWGMQRQAASSKKGIAQPLNRLSYTASLSHLRRVNAPRAEKGGKFTEPRKLHSSQWQRFCASETPDGHTIGFLKNLALLSHITIGSNPDTVLSKLREEFKNVFPILNATAKQMAEQVRIFVNGNPFGCTSEPRELVLKLLDLRRSGAIDIYTSISWVVEEQEIRIHTEAGRICRPVYVVNNNRLVITLKDFKDVSTGLKSWESLLKEGKIEYLDVQEEDTSMVATYYEDLLNNKQSNPEYIIYTHCEIHNSMIFGASGATIPFAECNQGIRIFYGSNQKKQGLGTYATNYRDRMDTTGQILRFPQIPLVSTRPAKYLNVRNLPAGQNIIVAIACFTGYNQEDSLIVNKAAIDRGLLRSMYYKTYNDSERKNQASLEEEKFCKPVKYNQNGTLRTVGTKSTSYDLLDENGFVKVGSYVKGGDVIIGKVVPLKNTNESGPKFKDASTTISSSSSGYVDWVYVNRDSEGYQFSKVRIRSKRIPEIGDKMSSRFGQKGTIGMVYEQEDMPYTADGIVPDIIINPACIPSRMTLGQLIESVIGKAACVNGFECDATPFSSDCSTNADRLGKILENAGFKNDGEEEMFNGRNGNKFKSTIFIGPVFYQRLKHMSKDKIHARATGPLQLLTRQPPEGRKRDGGLRFGEMERDCMLGHGTVGFLKEKVFDCSDKYAVYVCNQCGRIAVANSTKNIYKCLSCKDSTSFSQVQIPYSTKLFFQELMSMGILPRIFTNED
jgi:DNA-directed RNA polymerase II subunit RPB2